MRIVVFHSQFTDVGGAEILALRQAHYLRGQGNHIELVGFGVDPDRWGEEFHDLNWTLLQRRSWKEKLIRWRSGACLRASARRIGRELAALRPDLVLAHNPPSNLLLGHSGLATPSLWYCHEPPRDLYPRETSPALSAALSQGEIAHISPGILEIAAKWKNPSRKSRKYQAFDQEGVKALDRIVANSEFTKASATAVYDRGDIEVVYPMVFFRNPTRRSSGLDRTGLKVLVQTRMETMKNVDTVLRAFAGVRTGLGSEACLHLAGTGSELPYLRHLAEHLGILDCVRFHGYLEQPGLETLRSACDVLALLPWDEPFGLVFPESAAAGLLLIGSDHGGPLEILEDGRYGWNVPAGSPGALGEVFERIWSLPDAEVDRRRSEADRACRERYDPEVVGVKLRKLLRHD